MRWAERTSFRPWRRIAAIERASRRRNCRAARSTAAATLKRVRAAGRDERASSSKKMAFARWKGGAAAGWDRARSSASPSAAHRQASPSPLGGKGRGCPLPEKRGGSRRCGDRAARDHSIMIWATRLPTAEGGDLRSAESFRTDRWIEEPERACRPRRRRPWRRSDREKREDRFRSDAGFTSAPPERQSGPEPGGSPAGLCLGQTRLGNFPVLHGRKGEKAQKARTCVRVDRGEGNLSKNRARSKKKSG